MENLFVKILELVVDKGDDNDVDVTKGDINGDDSGDAKGDDGGDNNDVDVTKGNNNGEYSGDAKGDDGGDNNDADD